jgi:hypothetical protein
MDMRWLDRILFSIAGICFFLAVFMFFYEPTLSVPSVLDVGEVQAHEVNQRTMVLRNWAPWPIRILGGNFG